jgi:LmbE family N-acetylglucosaminyl deacetylase
MAEDSEFPKFERALIVSAHPDDPDFGAAGTVARLTDAGTDVVYLICTDGSEGGEDPSVPASELAERRYREQRAAAAELGVKEVVFLGYPDGRLSHTIDLRRDITRHIRRLRPDLVMTHVAWIDPAMGIGGYHPDHLAVGQATLAAVYPAARNPRAFPELLAEGLEPWKVREVWVPYWDRGDWWVDISDQVERKIAALKRHESQFTNIGDIDKWMRPRMKEIGEKAGFEAAEGFKRIIVDRPAPPPDEEATEGQAPEREPAEREPAERRR